MVPDPAAGVKFYTELFGWQSQAINAEPGRHTLFSKNGKPVAGLWDVAGPGPANWLTYFAADDVDAVAKRAQEAGGTLVAPPQDIASAGRMAVFTDATGATFAAWQSGDHLGAALRIEPGTYIASELGSSDLAKSKAFYSEVFGLGWGDNPEYAEGIAGGGFVFGAMPAEQYATFGRPPAADYWLVYFAASDVEAVVRKAVELGAAVLLDTQTNYLAQQYAILRDPQGATFGLNTPPSRYRN
jgi:predicted enzyme related to lactoylglutathione lyase